MTILTTWSFDNIIQQNEHSQKAHAIMHNSQSHMSSGNNYNNDTILWPCTVQCGTWFNTRTHNGDKHWTVRVKSKKFAS